MSAKVVDDSTIASRAKRRRSNNNTSIDILDHKYGKEFYIQTKHFQDTVLYDEDGCFTRKPADHTKHMICLSDPKLEDDKYACIRNFCNRVNSLDVIDGEKLYLIQCIHYNGASKRGKHIDNKVNGGHIIVGCTIGRSERFMELSGNLQDGRPITYRVTLPPRSLYVMRSIARYSFYHDPINSSSDSEPPFALVLRFGKFDIERGLSSINERKC
jgi:hypothetical protein